MSEWQHNFGNVCVHFLFLTSLAYVQLACLNVSAEITGFVLANAAPETERLNQRRQRVAPNEDGQRRMDHGISSIAREVFLYSKESAGERRIRRRVSPLG